jgi:hypothetical protein
VYRLLQLYEGSQYFIGTHDEPPSVVAMRACCEKHATSESI